MRLETVRWGCGLRSMRCSAPTTGHQRCWNHRALNVQSKLPKALHSEVRKRLREMSVATSRAECESLRDEYVSDLRGFQAHAPVCVNNGCDRKPDRGHALSIFG